MKLVKYLFILLFLSTTLSAAICVDGGTIDNDFDGFCSISSGGSDCDDTRASVYPGAPEICDGLDNDCDGSIDEDAIDQQTFYRDNDGDGYGDSSNSVTACTQPQGYVSVSGDCDDAKANVYPGAPEICDGLDNNCDTVIPSNEIDADSDGISECAGDCDDTKANVYPGADEIVGDGIDQDCDEGDSCYTDDDQDGYSIDFIFSSTSLNCNISEGAKATLSNPEDCDDSNDEVNPGADEIVGDGIDQDCDGLDYIINFLPAIYYILN